MKHFDFAPRHRNPNRAPEIRYQRAHLVCSVCDTKKRYEFFRKHDRVPGKRVICIRCLNKAAGKPAKRCVLCEGMSWRRDESGCEGCGQPFAEAPSRTWDAGTDNVTWPDW